MDYSEIMENLEASNIDVKTILAIREIKNELCCKCGNYKTAHFGNCDNCKYNK